MFQICEVKSTTVSTGEKKKSFLQARETKMKYFLPLVFRGDIVSFCSVFNIKLYLVFMFIELKAVTQLHYFTVENEAYIF